MHILIIEMQPRLSRKLLSLIDCCKHDIRVVPVDEVELTAVDGVDMVLLAGTVSTAQGARMIASLRQCLDSDALMAVQWQLLSDDPDCDTCGIREDRKHGLVVDCARHRRFLQQLHADDEDPRDAKSDQAPVPPAVRIVYRGSD